VCISNSIKNKQTTTNLCGPEKRLLHVVVVTPGFNRMYNIKVYKQDIPAGPATFGWVVTSETS
jgi:hypothetical protein